MSDTGHKHVFDIPIEEKVTILVHGATTKNPTPDGTKVGHDILKLWQCSCGMKRAYDLVRELS